MKTGTYNAWWREMGAISRGMMFIEGNIAAPESDPAPATAGTVATAGAGRKVAPAARRNPNDRQAGRAARIRGAETTNNKRILPPVAAALLATGLVLARVDKPSPLVAGAASGIVDLAAITVRPTAADAEYYRMHRIVDLPVVTVHPAIADQAMFLAGLALQASPACHC